MESRVDTASSSPLRMNAIAANPFSPIEPYQFWPPFPGIEKNKAIVTSVRERSTTCHGARLDREDHGSWQQPQIHACHENPIDNEEESLRSRPPVQIKR